SGRHATVGGSLSQGSKFFGSGNRGSSAETVLGLKVVTGRGDLVTTGSAAGIHRPSPFYRNYGPDLTGMFLGDTGAFGIKVEAALQLIPAAGHIEVASYAFEAPAELLRVMAAIGAEALCSECFAQDRDSLRGRIASEGLGEDLKTLRSVAISGRTRLKGIRDAVAVALGGRRFAEGAGFLAHCITEGRDIGEARSRMARVRELALAGGGVETIASIPRITRADPFPPVTGLVTPTGR